MVKMEGAYILDILRTPIGKYGGSLASVRPDDLAAHVIREILRRNPSVDPTQIEDVVWGAANQSGEDNRNVARMASLLAGLPPTVAGVTVNRLCASGLQAIMDASRAILLGEGQIYLSGGVESMSRAPFVMAKSEAPYARNVEVFDSTLGWRFLNSKLAVMYPPYSMGETAENVAAKWSISREAQDVFAMESQERYARAAAAGKFDDELVSVPVASPGGGMMLFSKDEHPRHSSLEKLASLKPAFKEHGTVTAGNSSGINDGAAACIVVKESMATRLHLEPLARVVSMAVAGVDPAYMGIGPVPAVRKALQRAGLSLADIDRIELNEAFAAQALACIGELALDPGKVNVNGGAIALGHPLGCTGVRMCATLLHEMARTKSKYGMATMCVGVGQGAALIFENLRR
jgi:acetyl-CoA C-acetyltransferase